ncbi:response regulator [Fibrella forsythiae]|uniref:histidine kinase n=1 Tax=Fibrella forsythiae TaxID=2817061 RepID=A0ABS3JPH3_9BACT|nr:response regulator [Fibrella forsythiae]MBO0951888.1 response regulator [Fibrella forsythiae]
MAQHTTGHVVAELRPDNPSYSVQVRHFSVEHGLPNRSVTRLEQDAQGFIWIGTLNNAYRFDGSRFWPLPDYARASRKQMPFFIERISSDQTSRLWFFKSHSFLDQWIEQWIPEKKQLVLFTIRTRSADGKGHFYPAEPIGQRGIPVAKGSRLIVYQEKGHVYRHDDKPVLTDIYSLPAASRLAHVGSTQKGSLLLSVRDTNRVHHSLIELDSQGRVQRTIPFPKALRPVCTDAQGNSYFYHEYQGTEAPDQLPQVTNQLLSGYLYRLDANNQLANIPIHFPQSPFFALTEGEPASALLRSARVVYDAYHDLFWIFGKGTLFAWHPTKGVVYNLTASDFPVAKILFLGSLLVDRTGGVWVGSNNGVLLLSLTPNRFSHYFYNIPGSIGYSDVATRGIVQVGNSLLVNAANNWMIDLTTGARKTTLSGKQNQQTNLFYQHPIVVAGKDSLWMARSMLSLVRPATKTVVQYPLRGEQNECWAISVDGRRNLWIGYEQGISYFDVSRKKNQLFTKYNSWPELAENRVNGFFPDRRAGGIWVAASSGLYLLDTLRGIAARYSTEQAAPRYLPFNHITYVHIDPDQPGVYWLATRGGGLIRWERAIGRYKQYTQASGLLNATLYCLYTDHPNPKLRRNKNRLWFTTDYGLVSFDKRSERFRTYLPKDGITHEEFNFTANYQAPDGRLFLGGLNGITAFWPNQIQTSASTNAPLVITQFQQLNGQTGIMENHLDDYQAGQPVQIASSSRAFLLSFALLDYCYLGQTRLWYRIHGWQDAWATQKQNDLRINGLPSGSYQLEVRMQSINGQWVSNTLSIPVVVQPPLYKRQWFMLLCLFTIVGGTVALFRWRNRLLVRETIRLEAEVANRTARIEEDKAIIEQQAAELRENATLKSRFFANVTHEFRTPLTLLLGPLTYLSKRTADTTTEQLLATMERNARRLQELVNDLLGLGKLEAGQLQLDSQPADLRAVVARTVTAFNTQASFAGIRLDIVGLDRPIGMLLDVPKLETVIRNLVANALRFTPRGGTITIRLIEAGNQVRLSVADTGCGIHPDDLPHVIERYYQSGRPNAPLQGGTGIGLAICHEYCQLWQGELLIDSVLDKGSTFTVTYPKLAALLPDISSDYQVDTQYTGASQVELIEPSVKREMILLVEDNPDMASYVQMLLTPQYNYHWCRNGFEALKWLEEQTVDSLPDLILTDMMMPEMDGMTLLETVRSQPTWRPVPVIMLTARFSQEIRLRALQLGVADYLTKPFDEDELLTRIQNLLDRAHERAFWITPPVQELESDEPDETNVTPPDETWLQDIQQQVVARLTDNRFQVTDLAEAANMSQRQFYRRLKTLTGLSPIQFVQEVRLQTAYEWIEESRYKTVKEVAHRVGFQKVSYFSRLYQQRFGIYPSLRISEQNEA